MSERTERFIAAVLLGLLAIVFVATALPRITAPFGDSDDGINAAVWGANSRALREDGILESRLGGRRADGSLYATHPPLIVVEAAVIEKVVGEHPWSTRAAAWLGSLAAIVVLYLLVRALGLARVPAAAATVAALAANMFFVYGAMLDTMIIAFPLALAVALVWYRQWTGAGRISAWWLLALATGASLGGWQATFLVGLCGITTAARVRRDDARALRDAVPYLAGALIGVGLTLSWAYWVYGSFRVLDDKLIRRTGGAGAVSLPDMASFQLPWLAQLLGLGLVACVACAVSLRDRRFRPLAALSLTSVIVYAVIFKEGSGGHQYWNYWALFPATIGSAYVFDVVARRLGPRARTRPWLVPAVTIGLAVAVAAVNLTRQNQAAEYIASGQQPYDLVASAAWPEGQTELRYVAEPYRIDDWARYRGGLAVRPLMSTDDLRTLAHDRPDDLVLVLGSCADPDPTLVCTELTDDARRTGEPLPRLVPARELQARLVAAG